MVKGYQYLYSQKIVHRDLKPENLMLHNGKVKIGDFGFGRFVEGEMDIQQRMSIKCTPIYASPQLLNKTNYSSKCDIWSAGCIFYKMLYGQYPFVAKDLNSLINSIKKKVVNEEFQFPEIPFVSDDVKQLIRKMLKYEEADRISWDEIFKHPLMQKQYNILENNEEKLEDSDRNNAVFQSIIQNRDQVKDNVVTDYANNFKRFANQAIQQDFEKKYNIVQQQDVKQIQVPKQEEEKKNQKIIIYKQLILNLIFHQKKYFNNNKKKIIIIQEIIQIQT
ncbi:protein kinase domain protein [Ichthyophthirius multifiliis]|uniref:Protein kinase domain protein n=1 Tax=Ichthyophthirius multifiliis TaxID=5932 RepID=G0QPA9_ICHMU|nr:protein kinase domain protein [Ichthyophthirius multifiliis]EGR32946.1 protein kinase domain protein [Ichthyophthirius multifiliis]|eukprot:XP_004036932.1 protein kinase domain protein [Ichthyophthirius multifiliis]